MGNLNMITKVDPAENEEALFRGETPKYRPVNAGSLLLKQALKDATKTASGKWAKTHVAPIQLGLGVKAGPERLAWLAHSAYQQGKINDTDDVVNAFNNLKRQAVLDAAFAQWPEATQLFNMYYGKPSIAIFFFFWIRRV